MLQTLQLLKEKGYYSKVISKLPGFNMASEQLETVLPSAIPVAPVSATGTRVPAAGAELS